jgi:hypothetical protein
MLVLDTGIESLSKSIYPMFSSLVVLLCILCEGVGARLSRRVYLVLVEVKNAKYIVVLLESGYESICPFFSLLISPCASCAKE